MKLTILAIIVAANCMAQTPSPSRVVTLEWRNDERVSRHWLQIETTKWENGYDPAYTRIVSIYKPMLREVGGQWEIMFVAKAEKAAQ